MKTPLLVAAIAASLSLCSLAEDILGPQPPPPYPPGTGGFGGPGGPRPGPGGRFRDALRERLMHRLPPEERERFESARRKALDDPRIAELRQRAEAANREFFEAMRKKMNEIDPGLEELIKKAQRDDDKTPRENRKGKPHSVEWGKDKKGLAALSEDERKKLTAAREIARQCTAVQAAEQRRASAKTPEERRAAAMEHARAMREAMLAADPSLGPILEKLRPEKPGKPD